MCFLLCLLISAPESEKFFVNGVGVVKDKEIVIDNIAFEYKNGSELPNGKTIAFTGEFDGKKILLTSWQTHKLIAKRTPYLDFVADGMIGDTTFQAAGVSIELNYIPDNLPEGRVRATGMLITGGNTVRYFITRMESIK